jgi:DNA invertase Pin-like site-specific DNA recombinase
MTADAHIQQKVAAHHLARDAYLYVRQSTARQVLENTESTERQYALRQRATALGWPTDRVVVIDSDLGHSGASTADREGFKRLVADVGMGKAGIVLGLEVSRLARNCSDWHRLLEICALTDTLILDEEGIYDPGHFNDRLLLGLKGTMSEAELHLLRARMRGGLINKARRGELRCRLPIGFSYTSDGKVVLDPDQQVQEAVHLLFQKYFATGAAHATLKEFRKQGILFPTRVHGGPRDGELVWGSLSLNRISTILHNPWYAGVYAFGRSRCRTLPGGKVRRQWLPHAEWLVLIRDAHPGYISWEQYLQIEQRLQLAAQRLHFGRALREGPALLQGRAICGLCGQRMHVHYGTRRGKLVTNYECKGRGQYYGDALCQSMVGTEIDKAMSELVLQSVSPVALELSIAVQREIQTRAEEADRARHRQVERAEYEADHARQRYLRVDPTNRLVADSLEAEWNAKLRALQDARDTYERQRDADRLIVDAQQQRKILALATDLPAVWTDPKTPHRDRKRILALLIEDVTLIKRQQITAAVRFRGGATTTLTLPRPRLPWEDRTTDPKVIKLIDQLADEYFDAQIAHVLNERSQLTASGKSFDTNAVRWVRTAQKLKSLKERLMDAGWMTSTQLGAKLGVKRTTLRRWHVEGRLQARMCNNHGQWLYWPPDAPSPPATPTTPKPATDTPAARGAV